MGVGDWVDQPQQQMQQVVYRPKRENFYEQHIEKKVDLAEKIVVGIGDTIGYGTVLVFLAVGALFMFKKRIKKWLKED